MANREIEVILSRHLADCLELPIFITDLNGNLIFYNESAEQILGRKFEDSGVMPAEEWSVIFNPQDENGKNLPPDDLPLMKTLKTGQPAQGNFYITSLTGETHHLAVTSFPLIGHAKRYVAAMAIFWIKEME